MGTNESSGNISIIFRPRGSKNPAFHCATTASILILRKREESVGGPLPEVDSLDGGRDNLSSSSGSSCGLDFAFSNLLDENCCILAVSVSPVRGIDPDEPPWSVGGNK